jgi:hypothetical protein
MNQLKFDPDLIFQWSAARSIARNLPQPVPDFGGHRVDTYNDKERRRWIFPFMQPGLSELARIVDQPRDYIKLCGTASELAAVLTDDWEIGDPGHIMTFQGKAVQRDVPNGYVMEIKKFDQVTEVRILNGNGELAASGYAVETEQLFVYDRIVTEPAHQRKGLGSVVMGALRTSIHQSGIRELLVATDQGRDLYETLGWNVISPFTTASLSRPLNVGRK